MSSQNFLGRTGRLSVEIFHIRSFQTGDLVNQHLVADARFAVGGDPSDLAVGVGVKVGHEAGAGCVQILDFSRELAVSGTDARCNRGLGRVVGDTGGRRRLGRGVAAAKYPKQAKGRIACAVACRCAVFLAAAFRARRLFGTFFALSVCDCHARRRKCDSGRH